MIDVTEFPPTATQQRRISADNFTKDVFVSILLKPI